MYKDLTKGSIIKGLVLFSIPLILGNLLQQIYNIADSIIVGKAVGESALASVGSSYTLMIFLTSIFLGLSMGSGVVSSIYIGKKDINAIKKVVSHSTILIMVLTIILNILVYVFIDPILLFLDIPSEIYNDMKLYLLIIFSGIVATSIYNYLACLLRSLGNSLTPLIFLAISSILNIVLDLLFVLGLHLEIKGAAIATVISQYVSAISLLIYTIIKCKEYLPSKEHFNYDKSIMKQIINLSFLTCLQQATMNFGILLIQRLVDSYGVLTMAAFASCVKIDSFAYLPVQDFGNSFSTFVAQNYGAGNHQRLKDGLKKAMIVSILFSLFISLIVNILAPNLISIFLKEYNQEVIDIGIVYLRIEGSFYFAIGILFLLYGYYRAIKKPIMSIILTVISLGLRVVLSYMLHSIFGVEAIWFSIVVGWIIADTFGIVYYLNKRRKIMGELNG